jgi:hypothetical protein
LIAKPSTRSYKDPPQPDCAEEQSNAASQKRTQKHEGSKDDTKLQIRDTTPNKHECRNSRRKHVDHFRVATACRKVMPKSSTKGAVSIVT